MKKRFSRLPILVDSFLLSIIFLLVVSVASAFADKTGFQSEFLDLFQNKDKRRMQMLVKKNKDIVPDVIETLMKDARKKKNKADRLKYFEAAYRMAHINKYWNMGDKNLLKKAKKLFKEEKSKGGKNNFRKKFIENDMANAFNKQSFLVRKNKKVIVSEINKLIKEAEDSKKGYRARTALLHLAQKMASMNKHWNNGDEALEKKAEGLLKKEVFKERKRKKILKEKKKEEKMLGNFVMRKYEKEMNEKGVAAAVYSHWVHRIWFACKVCHEPIFIKIRGANDISHKFFDQGKQCATCHNGEMAFNYSDEKNCDRCHLAGTKRAKALMDVKNIDHKKIREVADRVGSEWNYEDLPNGKLPLDRFGFINWVELLKQAIFKPITSFDKEEKNKTRETRILFEAISPFVNNVIFNHKIHSTWHDCKTCHDRIFKEELGGNEVRMRMFAGGKFCGDCHNKVAFTFKNCLRCHRQPKNEPIPEGVLIRPKHEKVAPKAAAPKPKSTGITRPPQKKGGMIKKSKGITRPPAKKENKPKSTGITRPLGKN